MTGNKGMTSEINVTPMIDVLLVLLIIFMVIVPAIPRGEAAAIPQPAKAGRGGDAVVLEVLEAGAGAVKFRMNEQAVAQGELQARLSAIYGNRAQRVLFLKGDDTLSFRQVAEVIDMGHAAGVDQIGLMTPGIAAER
jgi:biopolymer transport protein TolR